MRDLGLVGFDEPFTNLLTQGMVLNEIFFRKAENGRITYYNPAEVDIQFDENGKRCGAILLSDKLPVESDGIGTMSKSKNNGVDPQQLVEEYGADTARLFMMFASPPTQTLEWADTGVDGAFRFLKRLWKQVYQHQQQGIVHGTTITVLNAIRNMNNGAVKGKVFVTSGLGGMSGAQPKAAVIASKDSLSKLRFSQSPFCIVIK